MTRTEFMKTMAYIGVGCGKPLSTEALEVYFDLLGDIPYDAMVMTAKRVLMEHKWANFPSIAELREAASETMRGVVSDLSPAEAWMIAQRVVADTDPETPGSFERAAERHTCPPIVRESINSFGLSALCCGKDPVGFSRTHFLKIFEQLSERDRRHSLMPKKVISEIENAPALNPMVADAIKNIGAIEDKSK